MWPGLVDGIHVYVVGKLGLACDDSLSKSRGQHKWMYRITARDRAGGRTGQRLEIERAATTACHRR
jgi:hypothetical protein